MNSELVATAYKDCLDYIDSYWDRIIRRPERRKIHRFTLEIPHPYVVPNDKKFNFIFYWDTFFIFQGVKDTRWAWVMPDMIENFAHLFHRYHFIPNFNSHAALNRSQPPFLTSMIFDAYESMINDTSPVSRIKRALYRLIKSKNFKKVWLSKMITVAKEEYEHVWLDKHHLFYHTVKGFTLGRYGDKDVGYAHSSELESGWDFTSRFYNRCNQFLPIDLNVYLYKYELDFAKAAGMLGKKSEEKRWLKKAQKRKGEINKRMWNPKRGFFYDYGYTFGRQSNFLSLAGFTPLWAGLVTRAQAKKMVQMLPHFETEYGLTITDKKSLAPHIDLSKIPSRFRPAIDGVVKPKQWDYPQIWPPLEYLTVMGLLRYGFWSDAKRIMEKSVRTHAVLFRKHGTFFEKIDGVTGEKPADFHYPTQSGFGWTNAIFSKYIKLLDGML